MAAPDQVQQPQPPDSVLLQKFSGIKNTVTAERLKPDEFETAVNIDIDDAGQIHRRRGQTKVSTGDFHSLFNSSRGMYCVKNGSLGVLYPDYSFTAIQAGIGSHPLAYVEVGPEIYFSSPTDSGIIGSDNVVQPWGAVDAANTWLSPVVHPTDTLNPTGGRLLGKPPMATDLAYWNGRIYMAYGRTVWATELYLYKYVDKTKNYLYFESDIQVIGNVTDGIYVGTKDSVWFLSGPFNEMKRVPLMNYGALPGSLISLPAELVEPQPQSGMSKNAVLFLTKSGLVAGFDSGVLYNLTQNQVLFPDATRVASLFRRQDGVNQFIGVTDTGGSPSSNARIGDFVDVEIRRFQGA